MFSIQTLNNICTVNQFSCESCQQSGFRITKCVVLLCVKEYFQQRNAPILCIFCVNTYIMCVFESVNGGSRRPLELITVGMSLHTPSPVKIITNQMYPRHKILWCVKQGNTFKLMTMSTTIIAGQLYNNNSCQLYSSIRA